MRIDNNTIRDIDPSCFCELCRGRDADAIYHHIRGSFIPVGQYDSPTVILAADFRDPGA